MQKCEIKEKLRPCSHGHYSVKSGYKLMLNITLEDGKFGTTRGLKLLMENSCST
jgi:hypothetical protein